MLTPEEPVLSWKNELTEDPVPTVTAIAVEPAVLTVPIWSLMPLAVAALFGAAVLRRPQPALSLAGGRLMRVAALLLGPFGNAAIALPFSAGSTPGDGERICKSAWIDVAFRVSFAWRKNARPFAVRERIRSSDHTPLSNIRRCESEDVLQWLDITWGATTAVLDSPW